MTPLMHAVLANVRDARDTSPIDPAGVAQQDQADREWRTHLEALGFPMTAALGEAIVAASAIMAKRLDELAVRHGLPAEVTTLGHAVTGEAALVGLGIVDGPR